MKFQYISKTSSAPQKSKIFGYEFTLDGPAVEVRKGDAIQKLLGMAHVGFIKVEEVKEDKKSESKLKKEDKKSE